MHATLLVELLTEELPPKSLKRLGDKFASGIAAGLTSRDLLTIKSKLSSFATPRRLAVQITHVIDRGEDRPNEQKLMPLSVARNKSGWSEAFRKKLTSLGRAHLAEREVGEKAGPDSLLIRSDGKVEAVFLSSLAPGWTLSKALERSLQDTIDDLPVSKVMRWGNGDVQFARPVHGLVMLYGANVVPGSVLGLQSGNRTQGHRFMGASSIELKDADEYERRLLDDGKVIADFGKREAEIERQLLVEAKKQDASLGEYQALLDEVTALVEFPCVYVAEFDKAFLAVPQECLILTMRQNQKYFPLLDATGKLTGKFLIVSNMQVADPRDIVGGNQRVVRPRLEDARFFFDQDRKVRLEERVPQLAKVVYHNKLGTQLERVERVQLLAGKIARELKCDAALAERAAWLCKADLLSGMVGEFPELQGIIGRYYALHDREPEAVANAIEAHYRPRFAGDRLPEGQVPCVVALADKLVSLAGLFGIQQAPSGDKDPFGLRRAALGVVRILVERNLQLGLQNLIANAFDVHAKGIKRADLDVEEFIYERFAGYLKERGFLTLQVDAVLSKRPGRLHLVPRQLDAVKIFQALPEAESLAAANKRVANILRQAEAKGEVVANAEVGDLKEPAEKALYEAIRTTSAKAKPLYENGDYAGYLKSFSVLKTPVDAFFDKVMVMVEDEKLRRSRLALLRDLREAMNRFADISKLAA